MMNSREARTYNSFPSSASRDEPFEVRPRQYSWYLPFRIPWRFLRLNTLSIVLLTVLSVIIRGFLLFLSADFPLALIVGALQGGWFFVFCAIEYKRMRLYTHGAAVQAKAAFCGLRDIKAQRSMGDEEEERFAWVVEWSYTIRQVQVHRRTSMERMSHVSEGETFWVLVDRKNPKCGIRWERFSREGLVDDGIIDSDMVMGLACGDEDPRLEQSLTT